MKLLYTTALIAFLCAFYLYGIKPYFSALSETNRLLIEADIPLELSTDKKFRNKTIKILNTKCQYGTIFTDNNGIRCTSNAYFETFK